jgi:hypothetical protein
LCYAGSLKLGQLADSAKALSLEAQTLHDQLYSRLNSAILGKTGCSEEAVLELQSLHQQVEAVRTQLLTNTVIGIMNSSGQNITAWSPKWTYSEAYKRPRLAGAHQRPFYRYIPLVRSHPGSPHPFLRLSRQPSPMRRPPHFRIL